MELIYRIFAELARIIYFLVSQILLLIDNLSKYHFFSPDSINNFTTKIYVIVGVLMLFKLVISAVQYLVNPEQLADKNKGLSSILTKAVVAVALLVLVPSIFEYALEIQDVVVEAIPRFILSDKNGNSTNQVSMKQASENISMTVIEGFLQPKAGKVPTRSIEGVDKIPEVVLDGCNAWFFSGEFWTGANCIYDFTWLLIVPIGVYFVFITLSMAIDIGIRAIKLGIVQILAPIPIVSYISDEKKFNTWVKTSVKVYVDLFIRMAVIYLVVYFINVIIVSTFGHSGYPTEFAQRIGRTPEPMEIVFVKVAIIIALLLFAKEAPKFICDLLGVDTGDDSIANMFKRAGGMFGATAAGVRAARSNYTTQKERFMSKNKSKGRQIAEGLRGAAGGFGSALGRGMFMATQGKGFKDTRQGAFKSAIDARDNRIDRLDNLYKTDVDKYIQAVDENGQKLFKNGKPVMIKNPEYYSRADARRDIRREKLGIPTDTAFIKARYDTMSGMAKDAAAAKSHGDGKREETPDRYSIGLDLSKDPNGEYKDSDAIAIYNALGFDSLTMEHARNLYALAKNGTEVEDSTGRKRKLNSDQLNALGNIVQKVEKRTSYMKEAELMGTGDPTAVPNAQKLRIQVENNRTMFNDPEVMGVISARLGKLGINVSNVGELLEEIKKLSEPITIKAPSKPIRPDILSQSPPQAPVRPQVPVEPTAPVMPVAPDSSAPQYEHIMYVEKRKAYEEALQKYQQDHLAYESDRATYSTRYNDWVTANNNYNTELTKFNSDVAAAQADFDTKMQNYDSQYNKWITAVNNRADILSGVKDAFEYVSKTEYAPAQAADVRNQKAQQAVKNNNDSKKGS